MRSSIRATARAMRASVSRGCFSMKNEGLIALEWPVETKGRQKLLNRHRLDVPVEVKDQAIRIEERLRGQVRIPAVIRTHVRIRLIHVLHGPRLGKSGRNHADYFHR